MKSGCTASRRTDAQNAEVQVTTISHFQKQRIALKGGVFWLFVACAEYHRPRPRDSGWRYRVRK